MLNKWAKLTINKIKRSKTNLYILGFCPYNSFKIKSKRCKFLIVLKLLMFKIKKFTYKFETIG